MDIKNFLNSLFSSNENKDYEFNLIEDANTNNSVQNDDITKNDETEIFSDLQSNLNYVKTKYNLMINSDIIFREFTLKAKGKSYQSFLLFIDGMVNSDSINDFILKPLMQRSIQYNNPKVTVQKVQKFDLSAYISETLVPQSDVKNVSTFEDIFEGVNSGNCALFVDTLNCAFDIDVKGFSQRSIEQPSNEIVINGPHESFVENIRTNTSLLRRYVNNEHLVIENTTVGKITKTRCGICYIDELTNSDLIAEVKYRINNLDIDSLLSAGQLEQLITDTNALNVPQALSTERPDKSASYLLDGRVIILINGSPYALIVPAILTDYLNSPDDKNTRPLLANFVKTIRLIAALITLLLPGLYVAVTSFHSEILPTELLFSILASRVNVPFPIIFELLLMELAFELIREAGLRIPSPIGSTIGIVGGLIIGQAAVSAGIVSPILLIVVAITGTASFAMPDYSFGFHLRVYRFFFIFLGYLCGFLGIALGLFIYALIMCETKSFGVPYTLGVSPLENIKGESYYFPPIWKREYRSSYVKPQKEEKQEHISMKWKNNN